MIAATNADSYAQKRLACYACRDKKLRCTTVRGESCDRCLLQRQPCRRPASKRKSGNASIVDHSPHCGTQLAHQPARRSASPPDIPRLPSQSATPTRRPCAPTPASQASADNGVGEETSPEQVLQPLDSAEHLFWSTLGQQRSTLDTFAFSELSECDNADLDPIGCHILTTRQALEFYDRFLDTFGRTLAYFDPRLSTFDFIRSQSYALLSVICFTMARAEPDQMALVPALERHVHQTVYPALLLGGYASIAIVQAFMLLAAFERPSDTVREDRSWKFLSHASRVAGEINLQASLADHPKSDESELVRLKRRNAQRTWINLWLHDFSLSQHTGRQSILAEHNLFKACSQWHLDPLAYYTDTALVSMVELRTIIRHNRQLFRVLPPGNEPFYIRQCKDDLHLWSRTWSDSASPAATSMPRLELSRLYVSHALVQLLGLVLHHRTSSHWMPGIVMDLYEACSDYLDAFLQRLPAQRLLYCYNSMWVAASYQVVVALRLVQLSSRFTFIDRARLLQQCQGIRDCTLEAAQRSHTGAAAHCYARFLDGILGSMQRDVIEHGSGESRLDEPVSSNHAPASSARPGATNQVEVRLSPPSNAESFDAMSTLGFDDLEFFTWAAASLGQNDSFDVRLLL